MAAVDDFVPTPPVRPSAFAMPVEDVHHYRRYGCCWRVERGVVGIGDNVGSSVLVTNLTRRLSQALRCSGRFWIRQKPATISVCYCAVFSVQKSSAAKSYKPGTIHPHYNIKFGWVYPDDQDRGGRHKPFFDGYRPQFYFTPPTLPASPGCRGVEM